jgi:hypothetical protein
MCDYVVIIRESAELPPLMCIGPFGSYSDVRDYVDKKQKETPEAEFLIRPLYGENELEEVEA